MTSIIDLMRALNREVEDLAAENRKLAWERDELANRENAMCDEIAALKSEIDRITSQKQEAGE